MATRTKALGSQNFPDHGRECQSSAFQWVASPVEENGWLNFENATEVLPWFCLRQRARSLLKLPFRRAMLDVLALLEEEACNSFILCAIGNSRCGRVEIVICPLLVFG